VVSRATVVGAAHPAATGAVRTVEDVNVSIVMTSAAGSYLAVESDKVTPGVLGFLIVGLLGLATWFLLRSMNNQLRKVKFEERDTGRGQGGRAGTAGESTPDDGDGTPA
jgi:hypothetical protein